ncbi:hypothetical protein ABEB36_010854 [Hypothenemus hampei]|uniref:Uncharacterized protein n=1 Tax=Hypothenemus hampei TaxID=57062 RepID=A0ABD1EFA5_HYPHA
MNSKMTFYKKNKCIKYPFYKWWGVEMERDHRPKLLAYFQEFSDFPPIPQGTISKIEKQFCECMADKKPFNVLSNNTKVDVMLEFEENPHNSAPTSSFVIGS